MEIIGQIFREENYEVFRRLSDNRDVTQSRIDKLVASISEKYITNPIVVNEKMEIIDGQGRFDALRKIGKPIDYVIANGANITDCRRMNKYNTKWSGMDFATSYAKGGNENYKLFICVCKETKLPISTVLRLANKDSYHFRTNFNEGALKFKEEDAEKVRKAFSASNDIAEALQVNNRKNDAFYIAVKITIETDKYNHARMLKNCKLCRSSYSQMATLTDQLVEFERIYNYKVHTQNRLYFSDYMRNRGANVRNYVDMVVQNRREDDASTLKTIE